jgi:hypothetical protein
LISPHPSRRRAGEVHLNVEVRDVRLFDGDLQVWLPAS